MIRSFGLAAAAVLCLSAAAPAASARRQIQSAPERDRTLARFLAPTTPALVSYRAVRHLRASTRGGKMWASMTAETSLNPSAGFSFTVTAEDGSGLIRRRVLLAALEAEQRAISEGDNRRAALTPDNYEFLDITADPGELVKIDVRPRRKHVMLIDGSLFVRPDTAELVRVEGELSQRPSFWTRRVRVVRSYAEIAGVHVPVAMRSIADVLIAGTSTFEMTYDYSEINGKSL